VTTVLGQKLGAIAFRRPRRTDSEQCLDDVVAMIGRVPLVIPFSRQTGTELPVATEEHSPHMRAAFGYHPFDDTVGVLLDHPIFDAEIFGLGRQDVRPEVRLLLIES